MTSAREPTAALSVDELVDVLDRLSRLRLLVWLAEDGVSMELLEIADLATPLAAKIPPASLPPRHRPEDS